jgi:hypothetical protein
MLLTHSLLQALKDRVSLAIYGGPLGVKDRTDDTYL